MRISEHHLKHWLEHGYAVVPDFLTPAELAAAQAELVRTFPTREAYRAAPMLYRNDDRGGQMRELPYLGDLLNFTALHAELVSFAEKALETTSLALAQSLVWAKYPGDDYDMPLHVDYMNTSMLYPNNRGPREQVTFILYYVDVDEQLGATYVVSTQHSRGELLVPYLCLPDQFPDFYRHEQPVHVRAGSLLIYNMATFHRASSITARDRIRFSHHIVYRSEAAPWVGYRVWATHGLSPELQRFIELASPRQRELLGFPPLGHTYWHEETLMGIAARYPRMDMRPYLEAADLPSARKEQLRETFRRPRTTWTGLTFPPDDSDQHSTQGGEHASADLAYN